MGQTVQCMNNRSPDSLRCIGWRDQFLKKRKYSLYYITKYMVWTFNYDIWLWIFACGWLFELIILFRNNGKIHFKFITIANYYFGWRKYLFSQHLCNMENSCQTLVNLFSIHLRVIDNNLWHNNLFHFKQACSWVQYCHTKMVKAIPFITFYCVRTTAFGVYFFRFQVFF